MPEEVRGRLFAKGVGVQDLNVDLEGLFDLRLGFCRGRGRGSCKARGVGVRGQCGYAPLDELIERFDTVSEIGK